MENTKELLYESPAAEFIMFDANDCFLRTSGTNNTGYGDNNNNPDTGD